MENQIDLSLDATKQKWKDAKGFPGLGRKLRVLVAPANRGGKSKVVHTIGHGLHLKSLKSFMET